MDRRVPKDGLPYLLATEDLPASTISRVFEGYRFGDVDVSFFLVESPPGTGARLHYHPYEEVFVMLEGEATFRVGEATIGVAAGQIVVAPANVPHKFTNTGTGLLRQVDIHTSGRIIQTDLPEEG